MRPVAALSPPVMPQLALSRAALPEGEDWSYEPKWDGFRAIAFVDGDESFLQSRNGQAARPLLPRARVPPGEYVLDGELVILGEGGKQEFDAAPAADPSGGVADPQARRRDARAVRGVRPAGRGREVLLEEPFEQRRERLEQIVRQAAGPDAVDHRPGAGRAVAAGRRGRDRQGARCALPARRAHRDGEGEARADDRRRDRRLAPGQGGGHARLADPRSIRRAAASCRSSGTAPASARSRSGSCRRSSLPTRPASAAAATRAAGTRAASSSGASVRPELVAEVTFDHVSGHRIRHGAKLKRWREDKDAARVHDRPAGNIGRDLLAGNPGGRGFERPGLSADRDSQLRAAPTRGTLFAGAQGRWQ